MHDELRGDVGARGFWKRGVESIFDVRIVDTDCKSHMKTAPNKVLARQEKQKKSKYLQHCLDARKTFTPLVFSIDGLMAVETTAAVKRLSSLLSTKWNRTYSEVCGFVRSRIALSLVRATSLCLRGPRSAPSHTTSPYWESGSGLALYWG